MLSLRNLNLRFEMKLEYRVTIRKGKQSYHRSLIHVTQAYEDVYQQQKDYSYAPYLQISALCPCTSPSSLVTQWVFRV